MPKHLSKYKKNIFLIMSKFLVFFSLLNVIKNITAIAHRNEFFNCCSEKTCQTIIAFALSNRRLNLKFRPKTIKIPAKTGFWQSAHGYDHSVFLARGFIHASVPHWSLKRQVFKMISLKIWLTLSVLGWSVCAGQFRSNYSIDGVLCEKI